MANTNHKIMLVDPVQLRPHSMYEGSPRMNEPVDDLVESFQKFGYLTAIPMIVAREGKKGFVAAGLRRLRAALKVRETDPDFKVAITILDENDPNAPTVSHYLENAMRKDNSPLTEAFEIHTAVANGMSYEQIADAKGFNHQTARNYAALHTMPESVKTAVEKGWRGEKGGISQTVAFSFNTAAFKVKTPDGQQSWNAKKIEETLSVAKQKAELSGDGKLKVSGVKAAQSGKTEKPSNKLMRLLAKAETTPASYAILLQWVTGDVDMAEAKRRGGESLNWLHIPSKPKKEKKAKTVKPATEGNGKVAKKKAKTVEPAFEDVESFPPDEVIINDLDAIFA